MAARKAIRVLDEDVVNKIAAAEIIHRPSNAIKELLENSLDAGSTTIKLVVKSGGLDSLQIIDNGWGISKSDLPLLCVRFATSKIQEFSDLQSLDTYGFRGEALASISFVSRMHVLTRIAGDTCGYKAHYRDGKLVDADGKVSLDPKPQAANVGTIITAENLFYNSPIRRKSFKSPADEYSRIIDVVTRYAVHNPQVAWSCKKHGNSQPEVSTPSSSSTQANIALLYGTNLSRELVDFHIGPEFELGLREAKGYVSGPGYSGKKAVLLLFINNRLVDSSKFKRAAEALYQTILPKGAFPFIYASLMIQPDRIDVNVHPTKSEVHFLDEDAIIDHVISGISESLVNANASRSFNVQTLLPGASAPIATSASEGSQKAKVVAPRHKIRMDPQDRTLESMNMFAKRNPTQLEAEASKKRKGNDGSAIEVATSCGADTVDVETNQREDQAVDIAESAVSLRSVKKLRDAVVKDSSAEMDGIFRAHKFVGLVPNTSLACFQQGKQLHILRYDIFGAELFYQLGLRQFGAFGQIALQPAPSIKDMLEAAISEEEGLEEAGLVASDLVEGTLSTIIDRREMLEEYFAVGVSSDGRLTQLPSLLPGYVPSLDRLPWFLLSLGVRVDWQDEKECFCTFLRELALFHTPRIPFLQQQQPDAEAPVDPSQAEEFAFERHQIEHVLFPAFAKHASFPASLGSDIKQIADIANLYRVFERC